MPKTSAKELQRRKEAARLLDKQRQWMDAKKAELEKQGRSTEQICDELGILLGPKFSPAMEFLLNRLNGVPVANFDAELHRIIVDLLRSDIELDHFSRQLIADYYQALAFPPEAPAANRMQWDVQAKRFEGFKRLYIDRGDTAGDAEHKAAKASGVSLAALRKRRQRR